MLVNPASSRDFGDITAQEAEPWVCLANSNDLAHWSRDDEIRHNQQNRQREKYRFFVNVFDFLSDNRIAGDYHEYGCHRVRTFRMALSEAKRHSLSDMKFYAFDSFRGLPPVTSNPANEIWQQGALATSLEEFWQIIRRHGIYAGNIVAIEGYYCDTLTHQRREEFSRDARRIALATIDCDLYESAVSVFAFIEPLLQEGSVLYLDDLFAGYRGSPARGVARAFLEFQQVSRFKFIRHCDVGWWGRSYIAYRPDPSLPTGVL